MLWSGNRWGSDPVNDPPLFDNSLQYWTLLEFASVKSSIAAPIKEITWQDSVVIVV